MNKLWRRCLNVFIIVFTVLAVSYTFVGHAAKQSTQVSWNQYSDKAFKRASYEKRLVFLYGYVPWCHFCQRMQSTLNDPNVVSILSTRFVPIKINLEQETAIADQYDINAYPTIVIIDGNRNVVEKFSGYMSADSLAAKLNSISGR